MRVPLIGQSILSNITPFHSCSLQFPGSDNLPYQGDEMVSALFSQLFRFGNTGQEVLHQESFSSQSPSSRNSAGHVLGQSGSSSQVPASRGTLHQGTSSKQATNQSSSGQRSSHMPAIPSVATPGQGSSGQAPGLGTSLGQVSGRGGRVLGQGESGQAYSSSHHHTTGQPSGITSGRPTGQEFVSQAQRSAVASTAAQTLARSSAYETATASLNARNEARVSTTLPVSTLPPQPFPSSSRPPPSHSLPLPPNPPSHSSHSLPASPHSLPPHSLPPSTPSSLPHSAPHSLPPPTPSSLPPPSHSTPHSIPPAVPRRSHSLRQPHSLPPSTTAQIQVTRSLQTTPLPTAPLFASVPPLRAPLAFSSSHADPTEQFPTQDLNQCRPLATMGRFKALLHPCLHDSQPAGKTPSPMPSRNKPLKLVCHTHKLNLPRARSCQQCPHRS